MLKASYVAVPKDVDMAKQARTDGLDRAGVRHLDYSQLEQAQALGA